MILKIKRTDNIFQKFTDAFESAHLAFFEIDKNDN